METSQLPVFRRFDLSPARFKSVCEELAALVAVFFINCLRVNGLSICWCLHLSLATRIFGGKTRPIEADRPILAWANSFFKWKPRIGEIFR